MIILATVLSIVSSCGIYVANFLKDYNYVEITNNDEELGITEEVPIDNGQDITNIALFGVDSRNTNNIGNSDAIMIISIDKLHSKVKVISIMRDTLVKVPDHGITKITEAYGMGGAVLAIKTLNQNFSLNIRDYATVNFEGMAKIVDAVGGVEINVSEDEVINANGSINEQAYVLGIEPTFIEHAGLQTLNGMQAVGYARIRKVENPNGTYGDFGRTDRQRAVMEQLFQKALTMDVSQYPKFAKELLPYVETSLDLNQILDLAGIFTRGNVEFVQTRLPLEEYVINADYYYNSKSTVLFNLGYASDLLKAFIYDDILPESYMEQYPPVMTADLLGGIDVSDDDSNKIDTDDYEDEDNYNNTEPSTSKPSYSNNSSSTTQSPASSASAEPSQPSVSSEPPTTSEPETPSEPESSQPEEVSSQPPVETTQNDAA